MNALSTAAEKQMCTAVPYALMCRAQTHKC